MQQSHNHSKICIFIAKLIQRMRDQETFPCIRLMFNRSVHTSWEGREKKSAGMKSSSPVLHDTLQEKKKTSHIIQTPLNLWNYEITGISQNPSVQIIEVHCRCLQFYITEGQLAIISTIIPGFQPKKKGNSDIINPSDQRVLVLTT